VDGDVNLFALLEYPAVSEACAAGPHELDAQLLQRTACFKRPKRYLAIDLLPRNSYGKVLKRDLRQRLSK
jgi:fatty-acyl-CoA synthase